MPNRIKKISMSCFRGATERSLLEIDDTKPIVFIFGENGTGKSTIVDAIDVFANKKIGSLEEKSFTQRKIAFLPSAGKNEADLNIKIDINGASYNTTVSSSIITTTCNVPHFSRATLRISAQIFDN